MSFHENQNTTVTVLDTGSGRLYVKVVEPDTNPQRAEILIRQTIDAWFEERPHCVFERIGEFENTEGSLGVHVWYHSLAAPDSETPDVPDENERSPAWSIKVSEDVASVLPRERIDAIINETIVFWNGCPVEEGSLVFVTPRRIAVMLNAAMGQGTVLPFSALEPSLDPRILAEVRAWLNAPRSRCFTFTLPDHRPGDDSGSTPSPPRVDDPPPRSTNMTYDKGDPPRE